MPVWVRTLVDDWIQAANLRAGRLFRRVNKNGQAWGDGLTEKAVWHMVREYARKADIERLAPHDLRRRCARLCHAAGGELEQFSSSSDTPQFKRPSDTSAASSAFDPPLTTGLASNLMAEFPGAKSE